ncbi:alpha/beta fold hydrolase [Sphingomonas mali]|uniref:alpha/beta fold hydrolase n=1 Tax=Sphingomonas mali TaxID=40682 RepID=UPI00082C9B4B|nr:alpha/beta hydrolase [Sphingomonas mali]
MADFELQRVALPTGVELDVAVAGHPTNPAIILLHGFPESHRTWRHQIADLSEDHFVLAPDQRGFAKSSKPEGVENYTADKPVADMIALADRFDLERFTLVGHDWGGAIAWMAALNHPDRVARLIIINAPHPFIFQRSMFDDMAQREASQYIRAFRNTDLEKHIDSIGLSAFFDGSFMRHTDFEKVKDEKPVYLEQWGQPGAMTSMLNWYRASTLLVPAMDETPERPAFLDGPFPPLKVPTLVIWGMDDKALLPVQLEGLEALVPDLTLKKLEGVGHFAPWEAPEKVTGAMREWLADRNG